MEEMLEGKTAVVFGGSSGIGREVAIELGQAGARVAIVASKEVEKAAAVARLLTDAGHSAQPFAADISKLADIVMLKAEVLKAWGTIDILVNSAGVFYPSALGEISEVAFDRMVGINLKGLFFAIDIFAPLMIEKKSGKIVNVASVAGLIGSKEYGLYSALKAGVIMLTKSFALQLAPHGINVNAIAPGNTETPINEGIRTLPEFAARRMMIDATTPSRQKFAKPEEIAQAVRFLVSERSKAIHGATLVIDEGRSAGL